jgi:glutamine amidotransferase
MALIAVLDYGIGNLRSAQKALQRVGADARLTADPALIADADAVVLPGVGNFGRCMQSLEAAGLDGIAIEAACSGRPFLGVCVGMQMLFEGSEEVPEVPGLGVLPGTIRLIPGDVKRPQMQWNVLDRRRSSGLLAGLPDPAWVYFVHSYAADPAASPDPDGAGAADGSDDIVVATCDYGGPVVAAVERGALWATQFHPEKSGGVGLGILANFVAQAAQARAA